MRPLRAPTKSEGIVVYTAGGVEITEAAAWRSAEPGDPVGPGSGVRTGVDGYCEIQLGDSMSVKVQPSTTMRWDAVSLEAAPAASGELTSGAIIAKVKKLASADLKVRTQGAVMGVRGTQFMVTAQGDLTRVTVLEGTVSVTRDSGSIDVDAGRSATARPGDVTAVGPASVADLAEIDAFLPMDVDTGQPRSLMKVLLTVTPADASILQGTEVVGQGAWGTLLADGTDVTLLLRRDGFQEKTVTISARGGRALRLEETLEPAAAPSPDATQAPASQGASTAQPPSAALPGEAAPTPSTSEAVQPKGFAFRADPAVTDNPLLMEAAARFAGKVPGFTLKIGDAPELIGGVSYEKVPELVRAARIRSLTDWMDWSLLSPALVRALTFRGAVWGVPLSGHAPIMFYNKTLVRDPPKTWSQLVALSPAMRAKGASVLALPAAVPFHMGMFPESLGVRLADPVTGASSLGSTSAAAAYDSLARALKDAGVPWTQDVDAAQALFTGGGAALYIDGPWVLPQISERLGDSVGIANLPTWGTRNTPLTPYVGVDALFVSSNVTGEKAETLKAFMRFLLEEENQVRYAIGRRAAPALRSAATAAAVSSDPLASVLSRQLTAAAIMPRGPEAVPIWNVYEGVLNSLRRGVSGADTARAAASWLVLATLGSRPVPPGSLEVRVTIDPAPSSQGMFFRPWDVETDLRIVEKGGRRGVVSVIDEITFLYLLVDHAPFKKGRAPALKGRITYWDAKGAWIRIVYDSTDKSWRPFPDQPDSWGAWKEAVTITCAGTGSWKTAEFLVPDALFDGRCNGGDLRLETGTSGDPTAFLEVALTAAAP
jgi:maltose-binding protein MalE